MTRALETRPADPQKAPAKPTSGRRHAEAIIEHAKSAKARKSGKDLTGMTQDELVADLMAHRVSA